jgi:hypothetical protein
MSVTLKDIKTIYPNALAIKQHGRKQLFTVLRPGLLPSLLISYRTVVGVLPNNAYCWFITEKKYSPTTSKQITWFMREHNSQLVPIDLFTKELTNHKEL